MTDYRRSTKQRLVALGNLLSERWDAFLVVRRWIRLTRRLQRYETAPDPLPLTNAQIEDGLARLHAAAAKQGLITCPEHQPEHELVREPAADLFSLPGTSWRSRVLTLFDALWLRVSRALVGCSARVGAAIFLIASLGGLAVLGSKAIEAGRESTRSVTVSGAQFQPAPIESVQWSRPSPGHKRKALVSGTTTAAAFGDDRTVFLLMQSADMAHWQLAAYSDPIDGDSARSWSLSFRISDQRLARGPVHLAAVVGDNNDRRSVIALQTTTHHLVRVNDLSPFLTSFATRPPPPALSTPAPVPSGSAVLLPRLRATDRTSQGRKSSEMI